MPQPSKTSKPSAKRRLDFDDSDSKNSNVHTIEDVQIEEDEVVEVPSTPSGPSHVKGTPVKKKRRMESYFSPVASRKNQSALVTPEKVDTKPSVKKDETKKEKADDAYVPVHIHKNLNYQRRGQASISKELKKTFALVEDYFEIPRDFESNKTYGPLSGTCFEERVVEAYNHGLLQSKTRGDNDGDDSGNKTVVEICSHCATTGHKREDCPELV